MKKNSIMLTAAQRHSLDEILTRGKALAWTLKHAQFLLKVDRGPQDPGCRQPGRRSVCSKQKHRGADLPTLPRAGVRQGAVCCNQAYRPPKRKHDGEAEAHLVALLCDQAPVNPPIECHDSSALVELEVITQSVMKHSGRC